MIHKSPSPIPGRVRVTFELPSCVWADRIFLVGDFNQWDQKATPMGQDRDGVWRAVLDLEHGKECEFRYLIDGQWRTDYHADGATSNGYGTENSVVRATMPEGATAGEWLSSHVHDGVAYAVRAPSALKSAAPVKLERRRRTVFGLVRAA
jgi:1,4-alpha-glucan branching enzyme